MQLLFTLTDVLLLLLLWKAMRAGRQSFYFNPYLSGPDRFLDRILDYAAPVFPGVPRRGVAIAVFLFILAFRNLLFPQLDGAPVADYGSGMVFLAPDGMPRLARVMLSGTIRFLQFLLSFWGASLVIKVLSGEKASSRTADALRDLTFPFSRLTPWTMGLVLVLANALVALLLFLVTCPLAIGGQGGGAGFPALVRAPHGGAPLVALWLGFLGSLRSLLFLQELLMVLIFTSLFSLLFAKRGIALFCQEALDLALGRLTAHPLRLGAFDFTPILYYMGLSFAYFLLCRILFLLQPALFTLYP